MISIRTTDVPKFLRSTAHFANLFEGVEDGALGETAIEIPVDCLKQTLEVKNENDLRALLLTVRFWLVPECAESNDVYSYAMKDKQSFCRLMIEFEHDFPTLAKLSCALQSKQDCTLMGSAVQLGLLSFIKYLRATGTPWQTGTPMQFNCLAAYSGQLECLQYGVENGCVLNQDACSMAAREGHLDCLKYAHARGVAIPAKAAEKAVLLGHVTCIRYIVESKAVQTKYFCDVAARTGNADMLNHLLSMGCEITVAAANAAAAYDHIECLKLLHNMGCVVTSETSYVAVHCGSLQCVEFLHSISCDWDAVTLEFGMRDRIARARGCTNETFPADRLLNTFMYAAEHGCPVTLTAVTLAVQLGLVDFVMYLHDRGVALDASSFQAAVIARQIDSMQYFLDHKYCGRVDDYVTAVLHGHMNCVECLHEYGVVWDATVTAEAVRADQPVILGYLLEHGCPTPEDILVDAVRRQNLACFKCLHEHGLTLTEAVVTAAVVSDAVECLQYALSQGCSFSADTAKLAATHGSVQCLDLLQEHSPSMT